MTEHTKHEEARKHALESLDNADWSYAHWKAVFVAGSGFLTDSYDNFVISLMVPMIAYTYYGKESLSSFEDGWIKAASSYGNLVGQLVFGVLGDMIGRKRIYGIELLILIVGAIGCALAAQPARGLSILAVLGFWRFILGIGVGGDYPVSSVITAEFANSKNRGTMIALVFAMQGIGIVLGALVAVIGLAVMHGAIEEDIKNLDYVWRFMAGFGIVPALAAVYYRLTITETPRYTMEVEGNYHKAAHDAQRYLVNHGIVQETHHVADATPKKPAVPHHTKFFTYFSKWENLKVLIACSMCWFLLDIGYYGTNLNTSVVLSAIGYSDKSSPFNYVWSTAVGQLIIAFAGNVPGYFFCVAFVDRMGRKPIQIMGFTMLTVCFGILAIGYNALKSNALPAFVVIYSLAQFFFNFGPNTTTFIYPAEVFPTSVRSSAHGISAASGKLGALIAAQLFSLLADAGGPVGKKTFMSGVLGIFAALCFIGLLFTFWLPETNGKTLEQLSDERHDPLRDSNLTIVTDEAAAWE